MYLVQSALQEAAMHWGIFRPVKRRSYVSYLGKAVNLSEKSEKFGIYFRCN